MTTRPMPDIPNPVLIDCNPFKERSPLKTIFENPAARTLWLAWRSGHIVDQ